MHARSAPTPAPGGATFDSARYSALLSDVTVTGISRSRRFHHASSRRETARIFPVSLLRAALSCGVPRGSLTADGSAMQVKLHRSDALSWALISRAPDARLRRYVIDYQGYREHAQAPMRRLQAPFAGLPMIVSFGPSLAVINGDRPAERGIHRSFLAGLHDVHVLTQYQGEQMGLQVNFTLLGAYRFLGITMSDIANRRIGLGDLLGDGE